MLGPSLTMVSYICLKRLSIAINILLAIFGIILLLFGIAASTFSDEADETGNNNTFGVTLSSVCGSVSIMASVFGGCFVFKKKKWALFLYVFLLTIDFFIILWIAIPMAILHPQLQEFMNMQFQRLIPLDREGTKFQDNLNKLQTMAECCGLLSYEDWRNSVPQSCHCPPHYEDKASKCVNITQKDTRTYMWYSRDRGQSNPGVLEYQVYKKPCGSVILEVLNFGVQLVLGITFTFAAVTVLAVILAWNLRKHHKQQAGEAALFNNNSPGRVKYDPSQKA